MEERYNRQTRIEGWNQESLEDSLVSFVGDNDILDYTALSSAALGIKNLRLISPGESNSMLNFLEIARAINPKINYTNLNSFFVNKCQKNYLEGSNTLVDLNGFSIGKKLSLEWLFENGKKGLIVNPSYDKVGIYCYERGRENNYLERVIPNASLPHSYQVDPILSIVSSGLILEELKNILMNKRVSDEVIEYEIERKDNGKEDYSKNNVLMVGAGALGNFVGLGLGLLGVGKVDIMDPDTIEESNLNRQILFYDKVGEDKAETLAERISHLTKDVKGIKKRFGPRTIIKGYDAIFDCVDNFETRILLSERCEKEHIPLISGGTSFNSGQVVVYVPEFTSTSKEILGLDKLIKKREEEISHSCIYQPDPSVIMSNQIIGGIMVNEFRKLNFPKNYGGIINGMIRYDAEDPKRVNKIELRKNVN